MPHICIQQEFLKAIYSKKLMVKNDVLTVPWSLSSKYEDKNNINIYYILCLNISVIKP